MKLSVVILNYNVQYFLELCLKSVQRAIINIDSEIIVVDNNSEDDSCNMVKKLFPKVKLIENKQNSGFSKGNNIGVAHAKGDYICILNPDTVVAEDTFLKLLKFSKKKENLGVVGCRLINGSGDFLPESKRNIPFVKTSLLKLIGKPNLYYASHLNQNETGKVSILVGAFMFLKRDVYNAIGGFDEDYFMYGEDIDLSYRILKSGYDNFYFADVTVIHFKGESTLKNKQYAKRFFNAMQIFYKKHFKKNLMFDITVWFGIRLAFILRKTKSNKEKEVFRYVLISNKKNDKLEKVFSKEIVLQSDLSNTRMNDEVILDANVLSYKNILEFVDSNNQFKLLTYKVLPNESNFVIGSNSVDSRGQVIFFN